MAVSARTLSGWLRSSGALQGGRVTSVEVDLELPTEVSALTFVRAKYSRDVSPALPGALVIKRSGALPDAAVHEVDFYRRLASSLPAPPLVRCFAAVENDAEHTL